MNEIFACYYSHDPKCILQNFDKTNLVVSGLPTAVEILFKKEKRKRKIGLFFVEIRPKYGLDIR